MKILVLFISFTISISFQAVAGNSEEARVGLEEIRAKFINKSPSATSTQVIEKVQEVVEEGDGALDAVKTPEEVAASISAKVNELRIALDGCARSASAYPTPSYEEALKTCHSNALIQQGKLLTPETYEAVNTCVASKRVAAFACEAQNYTGIASFMIGQVRTAQASSDGMRAACESAANLNKGMGALSGAIAGACYAKQRQCTKSCDKIKGNTLENTLTTVRQLQKQYPEGSTQEYYSLITNIEEKLSAVKENLETCEGYEINAMNAMLSAALFVQGFVQSESCKNILDPTPNPCLQADANTNRQCTVAFCTNPANQGDPDCASMVAQCSNPAEANSDFCRCRINPTASGCLNIPPLPQLQANNSFSSEDPDYNFDPDEIEADVPDVPFGQANQQNGDSSFSGGGGAVGKGSGLGGGPSGGKGNRKPSSVYNTDVTGGAKNSLGGGGGGGAGGGMSGYASSGGGGNGYEGQPLKKGKGKNALDLKKYLPGGSLAKARDKANRTGITSANGLSNFKKVHRAHGSKRRTLVNP